MLQNVQNQEPDVSGIMSIVDHEPESIDWMNDRVKQYLVKEILLQPEYPMHQISHLLVPCLCQEKIAAVPHAVLAMLFDYTWFQLKPDLNSSHVKRNVMGQFPRLSFRELIPTSIPR
eukprot:1003058-Prymnesium_polylepis.1